MIVVVVHYEDFLVHHHSKIKFRIISNSRKKHRLCLGLKQETTLNLHDSQTAGYIQALGFMKVKLDVQHKWW